MPSIKIFKRKSSSSLRQRFKKDDEEAPPVPALPLDVEPSGPVLPTVVVSPVSFSQSINTTLAVATAPGAPKGLLRVDTRGPRPPTDSMQQMWMGIADSQAGKNISKAEKIANKVSGAISGAVDATGSSTGVMGIVKTVIANEEVQAFGKTVLENVPALMSTLEALTDVHPFLKAAFLPFKMVYGQELKRRENDRTRSTLFEKLKDFMMVLSELKNMGKDERRQTPDGQESLSRVDTICKKMRDDIQNCYNVLNAQEKRSLAIKFLQATSWNSQLAGHAAAFEARRDELQFALQLQVAVGVEEIKQGMDEMKQMFMQMFSAFQTPQERDIGRWIAEKGGHSKILDDKNLCAELVKEEDRLTLAVRTRTSKGDQSEELMKELRKQFHEDVETAISANMESYAKRFTMALDDLNEDLTNKITHQGDRVIKYLSGGPHKRIKDPIMYHVWKEQGWRGSAKTRTLVLALRDYFVERVERSHSTRSGGDSAHPPPTPIQPNDEPDDPQVAMDQPLPDSWMTEYLIVKRLRHVQQALDNDASGFTTISEVNAFTRSRPAEWSLPKWIAYWAVGWQIYASKYCTEIEEIFHEMGLIRDQVGIKMPGNKRYISFYMDEVWSRLTALTSSVERNSNAPAWLVENFKEYNDQQETLFRKRLDRISYDIDTMDTVNLVLGQENIERVIFLILTLILRRHRDKMHLCLKQEMNSEELSDDSGTVLLVLEAAWTRFNVLQDICKHQQVSDIKQTFEWFSCGLFRNYYEWMEWSNIKHLRATPFLGSTTTDIEPVDPSVLKNILIHGGPDDLPETEQVEMKKSSETLPHIYDLTGDWYGYRWYGDQQPDEPMICLSLYNLQPSDEAEYGPYSFTGRRVTQSGATHRIKGTLVAPESEGEQWTVEFEEIQPEGYIETHNGILSVSSEILYNDPGDYLHFILKRAPFVYALCHRPLKVKLDAKELWHFAYKTITDQLRRNQLASIYIFRRVISVKRYLELLNDAPEKEEDELVRLKMSFTPDEAREAYKLYLWYQRITQAHQSLYCDGCGDTVTMARVMCLDCESSTSFVNSVDFCCKPECFSIGKLERRSDVTHSKNHLLIKLRQFLLDKDYWYIDYLTRVFVGDARNNLLASQESTERNTDNVEEGKVTEEPEEALGSPTHINGMDQNEGNRANLSPRQNSTTDSVARASESNPETVSEVENSALRCMVCEGIVRAPAWCCFECSSTRSNPYVCDSCEEVVDNLYPWDFQKRLRAEVAHDGSPHTVMHILIRIRTETEDEEETQEKETSNYLGAVDEHVWRKVDEIAKERLAELEERVHQRTDQIIQARLAEMEARFTKRLEDVLSRIEAQLQK